MNRVTVYEVAKMAGVHPSTVSRALQNHPALSKNTIEKVQTIAKKLGYTPDPMISALLKRRFQKEGRDLGTIAWISHALQQPNYVKKKSTFNSKAYWGAYNQTKRRGYHLELFWANEPGMNDKRLSQILYSRGIRGVCIEPFPQAVSNFNLNWIHFSPVAIGYSMLAPAIHRATPNHFHNVMQTLEALHKRGYKRIAMNFSKVNWEKFGYAYEAVALLHQRRFGKESIEFMIHNSFTDTSELVKTIKPWLHDLKPDVLLSNLDPISLIDPTMIPQKTDLALLNKINEHEKLPYKPVLQLDENIEMIGAAAVDLILGQIERNETGIPPIPKVVMIEGTLVSSL